MNYISEKAHENLSQSETLAHAIQDFVIQTLDLQAFIGRFDTRTEKMKENQKHLEKVLQQKYEESKNIFSSYGKSFYLNDRTIQIENFKLQELKLGKTFISGNSYFVDTISSTVSSSVTFFQLYDDKLIRVATTVKNFDDRRAIGTVIDSSSDVYKSIVRNEIFYGRAFVINRWYVALYAPICDSTGGIIGCFYLGIEEQAEEDFFEDE